ncbi:MAG: hypothetical protein GX774_10290 [Armatimonadetes bacterium]|jgi:membrane protein implicated in regulation of membrane protease activity|nr:hypothetical protein [Armatimonadota bacterium]
MDVYIFAGIGLFGVLFIILSFVMGELGHLGDVGDAGHEIHLGEGDAGHELHADAADDAPGPLSLRVISIFLSSFGLVGAACRLSGLQTRTSAALGVGVGILLGWVVWRFMRLLWAQGGSSHLRAAELAGSLGEVTVAIPASGPGQVACVVDDARTYQVARSATGTEIPLGSQVRVTAVSADGVLVEPVTPDAAATVDALRRRSHDG